MNKTPDSMRLLIAPMVLALGGVDVVANSMGAPTEFYARMRENGFGRFLDYAVIEATFGQQPSEALRGIPGVTIRPNPSAVGNVVRLRGCQPTIWLNGMRVRGAELDEVGTVSDLAGMEIYNSLAGLPMKYGDHDNPCGAILLWTRKR